MVVWPGHLMWHISTVWKSAGTALSFPLTPVTAFLHLTL